MNGSAAERLRLQGAAICSAADKLRKDLLARAAAILQVDAEKLQIRDGVISSTEDPAKRTTFAALVKANRGVIRQTGRGVSGGRTRRIEQGRGSLLCRGGSGHLDRQLALCPRDLRARHRPGDQSAGRRGRHGGIAGGEHSSRHRCDSVGSRISWHAALQRGLFVLPACRPSWTFPSRPRSTSTAWSRAGSTASRASAKPASARCRARSRMPSITPAASGFASIPSRAKRSWPACARKRGAA